MDYRDQTMDDFNHLKLMRNRAGEYISKREFKKAFEAILDIKRDITKRKLHPSNFDNILDEILVIGEGLTDDVTITFDFLNFLNARSNRLKIS